MPMSRIEVTAILKSCAEGGVATDQWRACVAIAEGILDTYGGPLAAAPPAPSPRSAPAPSGGSGGPATLTLKGPVEQKGKATRVNADGYAEGQWFSCFGDDAAALASAGVGDAIKCEVVEKPNPNGGRPYLNLRGVSVTPADIPY